VTEIPQQPFPTQARAFLEGLRIHWRRRGGALRVIPFTRTTPPGFPCVEEPALVVAQRQDFRLAWPGGGTTVREDEAAVIPADRPYRLRFDERRRRYPAFTLCPSGDDVVLFRRNLPETRWGQGTWRFAAGTGDALRRLLAAATSLAELPAEAGDWTGRAIADLVAACLDAGIAATAAPLRATRGGPAVAVRCRNFLRAHLADPALDVPRVAAGLGYNPDWLGRRFRRETGETLRQALAHLRVQRARELLRQRDLPIAEVGTRCGFASASHFSRTFKRIEGNPARKFRKYGHLEEG